MGINFIFGVGLGLIASALSLDFFHGLFFIIGITVVQIGIEYKYLSGGKNDH